MSATQELLALRFYDERAADALRSMAKSFPGDGEQVRLQYRRLDPQNCIEWWIPTAVVVGLSTAFFHAFVEEAGKDAYSLCKKGLMALYRAAMGKPRSGFDGRLVKVDGTVEPAKVFSRNLSVEYVSKEGWRVRLLFRLATTEEDYLKAVEVFFALLTETVKRQKTVLEDEIMGDAEVRRDAAQVESRMPLAIDGFRPYVAVVVVWDPHTNAFLVVDPVASVRESRLVTRGLGLPPAGSG